MELILNPFINNFLYTEKVIKSHPYPPEIIISKSFKRHKTFQNFANNILK